MDLLCKIIKSLKPSSSGNDNITLSMCGMYCSTILVTHIINSCLESGYFLHKWKESLLCPIPNVIKPNSDGQIYTLQI